MSLPDNEYVPFEEEEGIDEESEEYIEEEVEEEEIIYDE